MRIVKMAVMTGFALAVGIFLVSVIQEIQEKDRTIPVIESDRDVLKISCDYEEEELLKGLTASDAKDGDLTSQILVGDITRFIEKGVSDITYVVFDSGNQSASLTRRVQFEDYSSPQLYLSQPLVFYEGEGDYEELRSRVTATDKLDGDRTDWIVQTDSNINFQKEGQYHITYEVSNSYGDSTAMQLPVHVLSGKAGSLEVRLKKAIVYLSSGEAIDTDKWLDNVYDSQGDRVESVNISASGQVDVNTSGIYEIRYQADDGDGNQGENWLTVVVQE